MKSYDPVYFAFAALILIWSLTGCASFKGSKLPEINNLPPSEVAAIKPSATYQFASEVELGERQSHPDKVQKALAAEFSQVLRESGYFADLVEGTGGKNIHLEIKLLNSGTPAAIIPAVITGLSLYTIPSWATEKYEVTVSAKTSEGKEYSYRLENSATLVQWLPMIFVLPFNNPVKVPVEVRKNIYRNLIIRMQQDGLLPKASIPVQTSLLRIEIIPIAT